MANSPSEDKNLKKEISEERVSDTSSSSSENVDDQGGASGEVPHGPCGDQSGEKKRGRNMARDPEASSSGGGGGDQKRARKKGDLFDPPKGTPKCYICGKEFFKSWKAVFGHMSVHKTKEGRGRGAFPPPVFTPPTGASPERDGGDVPREVFQEQVVPALFDIAQSVLSGAAARTDGLDIDLNQPGPGPDQEEGRFDLNNPSLEEKKDDENKDRDDGAK